MGVLPPPEAAASAGTRVEALISIMDRAAFLALGRLMSTESSHPYPSFASPEDDDMDRLMRSLGYVLLHWSLLERAFLADIRRLRMVEGDSGETSIRARGAFSERLAEWRALMSLKSRRSQQAAQEVGDLSTLAERLRRQRNLIAQHFAGATTASDEGGPAIFVSESGPAALRSTQQAFDQSALDSLIREMDCCRQRIAGLADMLVADDGTGGRQA